MCGKFKEAKLPRVSVSDVQWGLHFRKMHSSTNIYLGEQDKNNWLEESNTGVGRSTPGAMR